MAPQHIRNRQPRIHVSKTDCPSSHSVWNKIARVAWGVVWCCLFRPSPRICFAWRRMLLRLFGADIGKNARISPSVLVWAPWNLTVGDESAVSHHVDCYCVDKLVIGNQVTVSQYAMICTASHDISTPDMTLISSPVILEDQCWICARTFISPGITVKQGAVAGAMSVITRDIEAWTVHAGNPARMISRRQILTTSSKSNHTVDNHTARCTQNAVLFSASADSDAA